MKRCEDRAAVVTGAAQGLGKASAVMLAREGARIAVVDLDREAAEKTAEEIQAIGGRAIWVEADVTRSAHAEDAVRRTVEELGSVDILVNSAGIARTARQWSGSGWLPMEELHEEDWKRIIDINLNGTFYFCQKAGKEMIRQGRGKIVNFASISGMVANKGILGHGAYCASKAGVISLTQVLAAEWARYGINVNCISPGWMKTRITEKVRSRPELHEPLLDMIPMKDFGEPEDVASAVVYLASSDSDYVTGHNLVVDGGYMIW